MVFLEPVKGEITIDTTPSGAQIYIDERLILDSTGIPMRTPAKLTLNDGWHDLVVHLEKYCREATPIYIYGNMTTSIHRNLFQSPCG